MQQIKTKSGERDFIVGCNKKGVLEFNKAFYKKLEFSEEEIEKLLRRDSEELQEGYYSINKDGVVYHGKINS